MQYMCLIISPRSSWMCGLLWVSHSLFSSHPVHLLDDIVQTTTNDGWWAVKGCQSHSCGWAVSWLWNTWLINTWKLCLRGASDTKLPLWLCASHHITAFRCFLVLFSSLSFFFWYARCYRSSSVGSKVRII